MTREEQLKEAIDKVAQEQSSPVGKIYDTLSIESALQCPSILRHADPEIMKQAGWVREEEWISVEDRLPEQTSEKFGESDYVLGMCQMKQQVVCWYNHKSKDWVVAHYRASSEPITVTHWKPL